MKEMLSKLSQLGGSLAHQPWPYWAAAGGVLLGVLLLASTFISMSYDLTQTFKSSNEVVASADKPPLVAEPGESAMNLKRAELFGENPAGQASRLALLGVGASEDKKAASAIISIDGGPADTYRVGDKPIPGMAIVSITPDTVILLHDGVRQTLTLDWGKLVNDPNTDFSTTGSNSPAVSPTINMKDFSPPFLTPGN